MLGRTEALQLVIRILELQLPADRIRWVMARNQTAAAELAPLVLVVRLLPQCDALVDCAMQVLREQLERVHLLRTYNQNDREHTA